MTTKDSAFPNLLQSNQLLQQIVLNPWLLKKVKMLHVFVMVQTGTLLQRLCGPKALRRLVKLDIQRKHYI